MTKKELLKAMNAHKFRVCKYMIGLFGDERKLLLDKTMSPRKMLAFLKKNVSDEVKIMERIYNDLFVDGVIAFGILDEDDMETYEIDVAWA